MKKALDKAYKQANKTLPKPVPKKQIHKKKKRSHKHHKKLNNDKAEKATKKGDSIMKKALDKANRNK